MGEYWLWLGFVLVVGGMLTVDLAIFHRKPHAMSLGEAIAWSLVWVSLAAGFAAAVFARQGSDKALEFVTGYILEWSLSVDNLFVFLMIFAYFAVPAVYQHRVLFWGIMGAVILRGVFILAGATLLAWFHWMIYVFGGFLVFTGLKFLCSAGQHVEPGRNPVLRAFRRIMAVTPEYYGQHFFVRLDGRWFATPLIPILIVIETTDIIFAVDSVPAIFGITSDPFIVYTSNIFAILGLRALFFVLAGIMGLFRYLKVGISFVLVFVGAKMLIVDFYKVSAGASLTVVVCALAVSIAVSLLSQRRPEGVEPSAEAPGEVRHRQPGTKGELLVHPGPPPTIGGSPKATKPA